MRGRFSTALLAAACVTACAFSHGRDGSGANRSPVPIITVGRVALGMRVTVDGAESFDPEGAPLRFSWALRGTPAGSAAHLDASAGTTVHFTPDRAGVYQVELEVSDGTLTSTLTTPVVVDGEPAEPPPVADAGEDVMTALGAAVTLDGSGSHGPTRAPLSYAWTLASAPEGSTATLEAADTPAPTLRPDVTGAFVVQLVVSTSAASSAPDEVRVTALPSSTIGTDVSRGVFDPAEVYLDGTLSEGACYLDALAHPTDPFAAAVGFDCDFHRAGAMLAADGTLIYTDTFEDELREFHCDGCPSWQPGDPYPSDPLANDTVLATPPCDPSDTANHLRQFELSPDGRRMHTCASGQPWYDETGAELMPAATVLHYGWDGHVLLDGEIFDVGTGARSPVVGLPIDCGIIETRAGATTGFRVVVTCMGTTELWSIAHDGTATMEGVYPAPPSGYEMRWMEDGSTALAGDGSLWQVVSGPITFEDAIIVRSVDGRSEVVYTEEMTPEPAVRIHVSALITGP